jgi:16S rRNA (uracil1498-N3)-methyltransferase
MKQFLLQTKADSEGRLVLGGRDFHYLAQVLRMKAGECINAITPEGAPVILTIAKLGRDSLEAQLKAAPDAGPGNGAASPPGAGMVLFQALPQLGKMDLIVRQAAEAGLGTIVPFISARSQAQAQARFERWERIVREARQQSGSPVATVVHPVVSLDTALSFWSRPESPPASKQGFIFHPRQGLDDSVRGSGPVNLSSMSKSPKGLDDSVRGSGPVNPSSMSKSRKGLDDSVRGSGPVNPSSLSKPRQGLDEGSITLYLKRKPSLIGLVIGPEGGFEEREVEAFCKEGFIQVKFPCATVLRCETAAIYAVAAVQSLLEAVDAQAD